MLLRSALAATVLVSLAVAVPGHAAGACDLVKDPRGDAQAVPGVADPSDTGTAALDVVTGDIASNASYLGVAIRVDNLSALGSVPEGRQYDFYFNSGKSTFAFLADLPQTGQPSYELLVGPAASSPNGDDYYDSWSGVGIAPARGTIDVRHNEILMTVPMKKIRKNARLTNPLFRLRVRTWRDSPTPVANAGYEEDIARGDPQYGDRYTMGSPSCLSLAG